MKIHDCQVCRLRFASAAAAKRHRSKRKCKPPPLRYLSERDYARLEINRRQSSGLSVGLALSLAAMGAIIPMGRAPADD